ncbi:MAG: Trm112 family protein [Pseudomonadota bacterium]
MTQDDSSPRDIAPELLELLVCPLSKEPLHYDRDRGELISRKAQLAFPIRDGVPVMLIDEARDLSEDAPVPPRADGTSS